jgi:hypothetical protein
MTLKNPSLRSGVRAEWRLTTRNQYKDAHTAQSESKRHEKAVRQVRGSMKSIMFPNALASAVENGTTDHGYTSMVVGTSIEAEGESGRTILVQR